MADTPTPTTTVTIPLADFLFFNSCLGKMTPAVAVLKTDKGRFIAIANEINKQAIANAGQEDLKTALADSMVLTLPEAKTNNPITQG